MARKVRKRVFVSGRVQGVFFRYSTQERANALGVKGWVRNRYDGRVEALLEGDEEAVNKLIEWMKVGPPGARVTDIEVIDEPYRGEFTDFSIAPTV